METENTNDRLAKSEAILDEYEKFVLLETEANKLITLKPEEISKLNAIQCGEAAVALQQYSIYLQRCINKLQSRIRWAEETIKRNIATKVSNAKGYSFEERKLLCIANDDAAQQADNIRIQSQLKLDRISFLPNKIESYAKTFLELQRSKRDRGHTQ